MDAIAKRGLSFRGQLTWYGSAPDTGLAEARCGVEVDAWLAQGYEIAVEQITHDELFVAVIAHTLLQRGALTSKDLAVLDSVMTSYSEKRTRAELLLALGFEPVLNVSELNSKRLARI